MSLGLVAWELCADEPQVLTAWEKAQAEELLTPAHRHEGGEQLWRQTTGGFAEVVRIVVTFGDDPHGLTVAR